MRRKAFVALAAALLGWTAFATLLELHRTRWIVANDPWEEPSWWRIRSRHVGELKSFLDQARQLLPADTVVAVAADPEAPQESFFRYLWIAYLLPDYELRHAGVGDPRTGTDYWISHGKRLEDPRFEMLMETASGGVYRFEVEDGAEGTPGVGR